MKKIAAAILFLMATPLIGEEPLLPLHSADLDLHFTAVFQKREPNEEIIFGPVNWTSSMTGSVPAQIWDVSTTIEFKKSSEPDKFEMIHINPLEQGNSPQMWDQWRYRHAYLFSPGAGYSWNSLSESKEPIPQADGTFYDHFLKEVWAFWTLKRLPWHLKNTPEKNYIPLQPAPPVFTEKIRVQYDSQGLKKPASMSFRIHEWDLPVLITFEVRPSTSSTASGPLIYKYRWTYDLDDWRNLHGYHKDFWGYKWNDDFPEKGPLTEGNGKKLDDLLNRTVSYWAEVVIQQLILDLEHKLQSTVRSAAKQ